MDIPQWLYTLSDWVVYAGFAVFFIACIACAIGAILGILFLLIMGIREFFTDLFD